MQLKKLQYTIFIKFKSLNQLKRTKANAIKFNVTGFVYCNYVKQPIFRTVMTQQKPRTP